MASFLSKRSQNMLFCITFLPFQIFWSYLKLRPVLQIHSSWPLRCDPVTYDPTVFIYMIFGSRVYNFWQSSMTHSIAIFSFSVGLTSLSKSSKKFLKASGWSPGCFRSSYCFMSGFLIRHRLVIHLCLLHWNGFRAPIFGLVLFICFSMGLKLR